MKNRDANIKEIISIVFKHSSKIRILIGLELIFLVAGGFFFSRVQALQTRTVLNDVIKSIMDTTLANGFHHPVGQKDPQGSYIEPAVFATARGVVMFSGICPTPFGKTILIRHSFLKNNRIDTVFSLYTRLDTILVKKNDFIPGRTPIGTIGCDPDTTMNAHLHFEIRKNSLKDCPTDFWPHSDCKDSAWNGVRDKSPTNFIYEHKTLTVPASEEHILIAVKHRYQMYYFQRGKKPATYEIALSQNPIGHKVMQGDNRLPEGAYRIIQKSRGPFGGTYGAYFGPVWIRINYPNNFDAEMGLHKGLISRSDYNRIIKANNSGKWPPKNTRLGGGIGLHGWNGPWDINGNRHLTWGCISMKNGDIDSLYSKIPLGTKIIILP